MIKEIEEIVELEKPDCLILLGDIKSSTKNISKMEWNDVPLFFEKMKNMVDTVLIPGNHDGNIQRMIPEEITSISPTGMILENVLLTHGHKCLQKTFLMSKK